MPGYMATVVGENINFIIDDEPQQLSFSRTVYVNAADESAVQDLALKIVREELLAQSLLNEENDQIIMIDEICLMDLAEDNEQKGEFIWYFPEEEEFDEEY